MSDLTNFDLRPFALICGKTSSFPRAFFRVAASMVKISLISPPTLAPILDLRPETFFLRASSAKPSLLDPHNPLAYFGKFFKRRRVVAGDNQPRRRGELLHAVLGAQIGRGIQRLRNRDVLFQVFIEIHIRSG
jgi:hypothetical protein